MLRLMPMPVCCTAVSATAAWATPALAMVATATPEPPTLPPPTVMPVPDTVLAMLLSATTPASGRGRLRLSPRPRLMLMLVCTMAVMPVTTVWPDTATVLAMLPVPTLPPLTVTPPGPTPPPPTATGLPTVWATTPASGKGRLRPSLRLMLMLVCTMAVMLVTTVWPLTVTPGLTLLPLPMATGLPTVSGPDTCGKYLQFHKSLPLPQNLSNQNSPSTTKLR